MSPIALKGQVFGCFVVSAVLLFVAWERYSSKTEPGVPWTSVGALVLAIGSAIGGLRRLAMAKQKSLPPSMGASPPTVPDA